MYTINPGCNITKVANGYVVELAQPVQQYYQPAPMPWKQMMKEQAEVLADTFKKIRKDDTLENLGLTTEQDPVQETEIPLPLEPKSNVYIFQTWPEVATFLQDHFEK